MTLDVPWIWETKVKESDLAGCQIEIYPDTRFLHIIERDKNRYRWNICGRNRCMVKLEQLYVYVHTACLRLSIKSAKEENFDFIRDLNGLIP